MTLARRAERFEIGGVVERTFAVIRRNFVPFYLLSLLLSGVPSGLIGVAQIGVLAGGAGAERFGVLVLIALPLILLGSCVLQAAITVGAVKDLNGERPRFIECLTGALKVLLPVLGIVLIAVVAFLLLIGVVMAPLIAMNPLLGTTLGLLLAIVAGLALAVVFSVTVPAEVIERVGVFGAFARSIALTRGNRWRIFGLMVAYVLLSFVIGIVAGLLSAVLLLGGLAGLGTAAQAARLLVNVLVTGLTSLISAVGVAAVYYELRAAREGIGPEQLAAVFD